MKLSTRGRYATRALLDLALNQEGEPIPLKDIAQRQEIPLSYLERLITPLRVAGLVKSLRGPKGGIQLTKPAHEIKMSEVIRLVEGSIVPVECADNPEVCPHAELCATREIWAELKRKIDDVLESITLQDLVERQERKRKLKELTYYI
jgi:Rrf2 family protein